MGNKEEHYPKTAPDMISKQRKNGDQFHSSGDCGLGSTWLGWALLYTSGTLSLFLFLGAPSWAHHHCPSGPNHKSRSLEEWESDHQWLRGARSAKLSPIPSPQRLQGKMAAFWLLSPKPFLPKPHTPEVM